MRSDGEWRNTTLGALVLATGGQLQTGPFGSQLHASDYSLTGTPVVMPANLRDNWIDPTGIARVDGWHTRRLKRHALRQGDIVFSRRGDVGRRSFVTGREEGWLCGTGCLAARFGRDTAAINPAFVALYTGIAEVRRWLLDHAVGGTLANLNTRILGSVPIRLPSRSAQDAIVDALSDAHHAIAALERLIAKKEAVKQGLARALLTRRTRLPGFEGGWSDAKLDSLLRYEQPWRYLVAGPVLAAGAVPVLTAGKTFVLGYTNETHGVHRTQPVVIFDDFTTASQYVDFPFKAKSSAMKILSARPGVNIRFMYELLQLIDFAVGDHKRYWISEYSQIRVLVPDRREQDAVAVVLSDSDHELAALRARLAKARHVKEGMMQELLTGRTRLPLPDEPAPARPVPAVVSGVAV